MLNTHKPIIITFTGNNFIPSKYYYYSVVANTKQVYFGKCFCSRVSNVPTIQIDLRRILSANAYNSQYSLKPVYDTAKQMYTPSFASRKAFADTDIMQTYTVYIDSDLEGTHVAQTTLTVTSAYDLIMDMPSPTEIDRFVLPLSYRTSLVPHYPNVVTDKYGIYFFTEHRSGNSTIWVYLLDKPTWSSNNYQLTSTANLDTSSHIGNRNTLPFNISLEFFFNNVTSSFIGEQAETVILNGGNASSDFDEMINGGDASSDFDEMINGGDASSAGQQSITVPFTGDIFVTDYAASLSPIQVAHIDECNKKYYLAWVTHSGAPFSWGFDGNTIKHSMVERTVISTYSGFDEVAEAEQHFEWELRSGIVNKETYDIFADIFDSPYLYLYSVEEDEGFYCTLQDNNFTWKKTKAERQPLNLTLNLKQCSTINK